MLTCDRQIEQILAHIAGRLAAIQLHHDDDRVAGECDNRGDEVEAEQELLHVPRADGLDGGRRVTLGLEQLGA